MGIKKCFAFIFCCIFFLACNNSKKKSSIPAVVTEKVKVDSIVFPFKAIYSSNFNNEVPDKDLLTVLNSYKFWQNNFMADLSDTYADTIEFTAPDGRFYSGPKKALLEEWTKKRDSIKTIRIQVITWTKIHEINDGFNYIDVWYLETDTYKTGKKTLVNFADRKKIVDGKITWYSQYRQEVN